MKAGAFTFVLHSHLPYCRSAGRWPHGEEWLHEAASETYIPLLNALYDMRSEGVPFKLTISLTPVLMEQLADATVIGHLEEFLKDRLARARSDVVRFKTAGNDHLGYLARLYMERYERLLESFQQRFQRSMVGAFRKLQEDGYLEVMCSSATHAYLPLAERDSSIHGQLKVGVETYRRHFGCSPRAAWLPECGYRPGFYASHGGRTYIKPGIEAFLGDLGIGCFVAETHTVEGGQPVGKAAGDAIGPYGNIPKRYVIPPSRHTAPVMRTTYLPYYVQGPDVAVVGRNNRTGMQVWSADWGYPGDFHYREFHKKDGVSGLQYWKVTGARVDLGAKEYYDPYQASMRVAEHSHHFAALVEQLLVDFYQQNGKFGIVCAAYDTELFGHWWFEGIDWVKQVLQHLAHSELASLTTLSDFVVQHPPEDVLALPESSWGAGGDHFTWSNVDTDWMWPVIHRAETRMEELAGRYQSADPPMRDVLNQAARELLLLQSSDWPFLITTGQAREYAVKRFLEHQDRFNEMACVAECGTVDEAGVARCCVLQEQDKVFDDIDYRWFTNREGYCR